MGLITLTDNDISEGLRNNEFFLVYQPIVSLQTGAVIAYEALARWDCLDRLGTYVTPDVFTNLANPEVSRRLTRTLLTLAEQAEEKLGKDVHFNLTCYDLHPPIQTKLKSVEIVEHIFVPERIHLINELSDKGISIWIDDLGSGYSPWQYLPIINIAGVKIDRELVQGLLNHEPGTDQYEKYCDLIKVIVTLSNKWGLKTIAEYIETRQQAQGLREMGVKYGQGWFFSKAIEYEDAVVIEQNPFTYLI